MSLGELDIACPRCGEELHVKIEAEGPFYDGTIGSATVKLHPILPEHTCPPPPAREPIAQAA